MAVSFAGIGHVSFTGNDGPGAISVPGLKVGDRVVWEMIGIVPPSYTPPGSSFEAVISVDDEIQQLSGHLSAYTCEVLFVRGVA